MMLLALFLSCLIAGVSSLQIKALEVPESIEAGQEVRLECIFDLEQEDLYSVKWFKDNIEIYRFVPTDKPANFFFGLRGVEIDESLSSNGTVFLKNTSRLTAGIYQCEVSTDAPFFSTTSSEKSMAVEDGAGKSVSKPDSFACSYNKCRGLSLPLELISVKFLPNQEQLRRLCPKIMTFLECETENLECSGTMLEEMAVSSNKTEAIEAKIMLGKKRLVRDLCDEDSSFHHDYLESLECFREYFEKAGRMCDQDYMTLLDKFYIDLSPREDTSRFEVWDEMICLSDALEMACLIVNLGAECGTKAEKTAMTALQKVKPLLKAGSCTNVEYKGYLKDKLLYFLNLDDERKTKVKKIFKLF